ncbi:MAG: cell division ATP-binding protein FtsE [Gammaproteobacteria bacterium]|nr:cell division ATP-binding protein FtsE [Gammaproteobacteria bacterium]NND38262.1 cell division ATP-binding protein FtsE [Pseudomonadales bacterium]NNL11502.1 cell division ATP-binding protein FtsE [Pseudomonadales bacterium]NNM11103.1 cell division ATP-binding protein FtsE [Pseudomonadales bacterium]RZV60243.1 MAG: cell division ATP-binding protein FtsE [Pseudomonadales bacterium]
MIRFAAVNKAYAGRSALHNVSFLLERGEMAFLTGHSGAGKSTLLKLSMLIERPDSGEVTVNDQRLSTLRGRGIAHLRRNIGFVYQSHHLLNDRNVFDNVALPLQIAGFSHRDIARRVRAALDKVGLLSKERQIPSTLSGGEQQRVGIARAVVNKPPVLLADEPTGNLDPQLSTEILQLLQEFNNVGVTLLVATHDLALIAKMPHRSLILRQGELIAGAGSADAPAASNQPQDSAGNPIEQPARHAPASAADRQSGSGGIT